MSSDVPLPQQDVATLFRNSLLLSPDSRTPEELELIYTHLSEIQGISQLSERLIRAFALTATYEVHESSETMYHAGDKATSWYVLLSGSVYLDGCMFLPGSSFGKPTRDGYRKSDCLILERSEMIVIDYAATSLLEQDARLSYIPNDGEQAQLDAEISAGGRSHNVSRDEFKYIPVDRHEIVPNVEPYLEKINRDDGIELQRKGYPLKPGHRRSIEEFDLDLTGLRETVVDSLDSDDEDDSSMLFSESASVRDIVRDCLEKDPAERTENDINILMDFMQHLPAFSNLSHNIKREMCKVMVFAVVELAGAVVMSHGEEMDSWSVILNGSVEIVYENGRLPTILHLGDSFGVSTEPKVMTHEGTMRTRVDDCQFVCIAQDDYWRIFSQGEASCRKVEEEGEVVMVTEHRVTDGGSRQGQVVIKGTPDRLLDHLMEDHSVIDPTYVEDFLLTFVVFFNKPHDIASKLLKWFERPQLKDKVTRVMLLWVNNHYADFEGDTYMETCLERFEYVLEAKKMIGQLRLLNMACSAKSKPRIVTLQRPSKETRLDFSICGGKDRGFGIFVSKVDYETKAAELGIKRGDQILEVNGQSFENITGSKAMEILMSHAHLCLTLKTNTIGFKEVTSPLSKKSKNPGSVDESSKLKLKAAHVSRSASDCDFGRPKDNIRLRHSKAAIDSHGSDKMAADQLNDDNLAMLSGTATLPRNKRVKRALMKLNIIPRAASDKEINKIDPANETSQPLARYFSRPADKPQDLQEPVRNASSDDVMDLNQQVIKIYRGDHTHRYFVLSKDTLAREVLASAIEAFGIQDYSSKPYFLCEVTVTDDGLIKQKRLPDVANNLANRISLSGRYYIKSSISEGPISDEVAQEISRDASLTLAQLSPLEIAKELTLQDFDLFKNVDSREYVYNLFEAKNERKSKNLRSVEQTTNTEMFWVISEICSEGNVVRRVKMLKYFIKTAKFCKDFKNYNSMFAIISGLGHSAVRRLKATWDKLPQKHMKMFEDLQSLMDPSRNMSKYRNLFTGERCYPPLIPFFPIVKKDITFLHLGNDTYVDGLVNFEKLRMLAREIRKVCKYCAIGYDPYKMDDLNETEEESPNVAQSVVSIMTGQGSTLRRSGRTPNTSSNPKKAYEELQTSRKIRQYLERLSAKDYQEKELQEMSYNCEPPSAVSTPNTNTLLRRKQSPDHSPSVSKKTDRYKSSSSTESLAKDAPNSSTLPRRKQSPEHSPNVSKKTDRYKSSSSIESLAKDVVSEKSSGTSQSLIGNKMSSSSSAVPATVAEEDPDHVVDKAASNEPPYSPRRKPQSKKDDERKQIFYSDSSSVSSPHGSLHSNTSLETGSSFNRLPDFAVDADHLLNSDIQFDDEHGQVSMV